MVLTLRAAVFPLVIIAALQLGGCVGGSSNVPRGGVYISNSAGARFDQSVQIAGEDAGYISAFPLKRAHRSLLHPQVLMVASGEDKLIVSTDEGKSWNLITTPLTVVQDVALLAGNVVVVSGTDGEGRGLIIRSQDNGQSWEEVLTVPVPVNTKQFQIFRAETVASIVLALEVDPFNPDRVYAGSNLGTIIVGERLGKTWRTIHTVQSSRFDPTGTRQNLGIRRLVASPNNPGELFIITFDKTLYRIRDGVQEEIKIPRYITTAPPFGGSETETRKMLDITPVKSLPNVLLAASTKGIVYSADNGRVWQEFSLPVETTQDQEFNSGVVTISPTNSSRLLVALNSVLYRSEDGGVSWHSFDLQLPNHLITNILINPTNAANVVVTTTPLNT